MEIDIKKLYDRLSIIHNAATNTEIINLSNRFIFLKNGLALCFNGETVIHTTTDLKSESAVMAKEMLSILKSFLKKKTEIKIKKSKIVFQAGKKQAVIITEPHDYGILFNKIIKKKQWKKLPPGFNDGIARCLKSCSKNKSTPALCCVRMHNNFIEATDKIQLSRKTFKKKLFKKQILLPSASASIISKLQPTSINMADDEWVHFRSIKHKKTIFSCRIFDDIFPDTDDILNRDRKKITLPDRINEIIQGNSVFAKNDITDLNILDIEIRNKKITFKSKNKYGWIKETKEIKNGPNLHFKIDPELFKNMISKNTVMEVGEGSVKFTDKNFIHVLAIIEEDKT